MTIQINEQMLVLLYQKARQGYQGCIENKENGFLEDEINAPLESIIVEEKDVKIVFSKNNVFEYVFEVSFKLSLTGNNQIGRYTYIQDELGEMIDEFLVFY